MSQPILVVIDVCTLFLTNETIKNITYAVALQINIYLLSRVIKTKINKALFYKNLLEEHLNLTLLYDTNLKLKNLKRFSLVFFMILKLLIFFCDMKYKCKLG